MDDCRPPLMHAETLSTIISEASDEAPRMISGAKDTTQCPAAKKWPLEEWHLAKPTTSPSSNKSEEASNCCFAQAVGGRVALREDRHALGAEEIEQGASKRGRYAADRNPGDVITTLHCEGSQGTFNKLRRKMTDLSSTTVPGRYISKNVQQRPPGTEH